jgi:class 3 adenylate cyclase/tetratricopeptide (TPR) repeat protein
MTCPQCRHENEAGAKFCEECATPLARACAKCGRPLSPTAKFCPECAHPTGLSAAPLSAQRFDSPESYTPKHLAEKILTSKSALEGERKQVTVLFADLKGSMELLADRDPEEVRKLLDPVLEHMMEAVHRYEGTVNQVMGDGIMALFGAPLAHEDHAVRACYAALRMQETLRRYAEGVRREHGLTIRIRVGLNSGDVVVRAIGSDLRMDYSAIGQTTHLAARMEQLAEPGTTVMTAATLALSAEFIEVNPLGPMRVKGLSQPVDGYALLRASPVRSRFQAHAARGLTKFVGRSTEFAQLVDALDDARSGRGQVVAIVGEPGVGKSRLFWELIHSRLVDGCVVLQAGGVSYGKAMPYLPLIELLRGYCEIEAQDDIPTIRARVTGKLLSRDRASASRVSPLLALLDVPTDDAEWSRLDPAQRRQRTHDAVRWWLLQVSQAQPFVLVFEDLQWIDGETQAALDGLVESLPTARLLLLVNYRPEYEHAWGGRTYYRHLRLDVLSAASANEFLAARLGGDSSLEALKQRLITRTDGNPFFLEESVRMLVETNALTGHVGAYRLSRPIEKLQIPATAQAILAARIDRLDPEDKRVLQAAAVVGTECAFPLLRAIGESEDEELHHRLSRLQTAEFLYESRLFPELEYTFKHALTHEVAYGGLLQDRRRVLHARVVDAIEMLYTGRLTEHSERLAHHALRGDLKDKATRYLRQSGLKAAARSALHEAREAFEQALRVLQSLPEDRATIEQAFDTLLELRSVLIPLGQGRRVLDTLREAERLAERLNDDGRRGQIYAFLTHVQGLLGEVDDAIVSGTRGLSIARAREDGELRILTTSFLVQAHHYRSDFEQTVKLARENLATAAPNIALERAGGGHVLVAVRDRAFLVSSLAHLGRFDEAAADAAIAMRLAVPTRHALTIGLAHYGAEPLHLVRGDWATAQSVLEDHIATARTGNVFLQLPGVIAASAWALAQLGDFERAANRLREGEQLLKAHEANGLALHHGWGYYALGRAALIMDRPEESCRLSRRALKPSSAPNGFAAYTLHLLGDIWAQPGHLKADRAEAHYREALKQAETRRMRPLVAHCHLGLGKLYRRTGDGAKAEEHLTTARAMYREMDMGFYLAQADTVGAGGEP